MCLVFQHILFFLYWIIDKSIPSIPQIVLDGIELQKIRMVRINHFIINIIVIILYS